MADTGIGIAPEHVDLIFQEFAQVDSAMQRQIPRHRPGAAALEGPGGTAGRTGLAWRARWARDPRFTPRSRWCIAARKPDIAAPRRAACDMVIIDDEEVSRYLIRQALGPGMAMVEAHGRARRASNWRASKSPRGILLDLRMPGMSGFEVLRELKADPATRDIPVVIMTSKMLTREERDILDSPGDCRALERGAVAAGWRRERIRKAIGYRH